MPDAAAPNVAIFNDPSSGEQDADVQAIVTALQHQVHNDFRPAWKTGANLHFVPSTAVPSARMMTIAVLGTSDVAGALGYHDLTPAGLPLGKVFAATDRQYGQKVSVTLSHELLEMLADPWINLTAQGPDGKFYAWEVADACEADSLGYDINGTTVSDFCYPPWWGNGAGKLDQMGHLSQPLELAPGGYISVFDPASGQGWQQIYGQKPSSPAELHMSRPKVGSRRERRFVGRENWAVSTYAAE